MDIFPQVLAFHEKEHNEFLHCNFANITSETIPYFKNIYCMLS